MGYTSKNSYILRKHTEAQCFRLNPKEQIWNMEFLRQWRRFVGGGAMAGLERRWTTWEPILAYTSSGKHLFLLDVYGTLPLLWYCQISHLGQQILPLEIQ